jgi:transcriptional regulator with XRE-family HTH domain
MEKAAEKNKEYLKKIGNRIRTIRKEKHLKQIELGYRCDLDKQAMSRIELGDTNPTILTLKKIADALEIDVSELLLNIK